MRVGLGSVVGDPDYSIYADLNASGAISVADIGPLRVSLGQAIPVADRAVHAFPIALAALAGQLSELNLDLGQVLAAGLYETELPARFEEGDFNRDGVFDSGDWISAFQDFDWHGIDATLKEDLADGKETRQAATTRKERSRLDAAFADLAWDLLRPVGDQNGVDGPASLREEWNLKP